MMALSLFEEGGRRVRQGLRLHDLRRLSFRSILGGIEESTAAVGL
jgi:hypothetical protein